MGKGAWIKSALKNINGDIVLIQDADLEYDPRDYKKLITPIIKKKSIVVYGSIVLYKNGASRAEIDYIRGVNSSFTLRALSVRGLVEKSIDTKDSRRYIYKPSFEMLAFMGVKSVEELPDYGEVNSGIEVAAKNLEDETKKDDEASS